MKGGGSMTTLGDLMEQPYGLIHFGKLTVENVVPNVDDAEGDRKEGHIVGRHRGSKVNYDGKMGGHRVDHVAPTITIRNDDYHKDLRIEEWQCINFEPCDDPKTVKEAWSE